MGQSLNFCGGGVHEVGALLRDGTTFVAGHFDNPAAADAAIATLGDYRAVWSTLNIVARLPEGRTLNPERLTRGHRVGAIHMGGHNSQLFDFDPPKPKGVMSTDAEHQAALQQALECRAWLHSFGWPLPPLADSGSGFHLRPFVNLDASKENSRLIERVLKALKIRFSFIDSTVHDLPRLCRYYNTLNAKGTDTPQRPWRMSRVIEPGEQTPVTVEQLTALCELVGVPAIVPVGDGVPRPQAQAKFIRRFVAYCERVGVTVDAVREVSEGTMLVQTEFCLLHEEHTGSSCGAGVRVDGTRTNMCLHNGCSMPWSQWAKAVEEKYGQPMRLDGEIVWETKTKKST